MGFQATPIVSGETYEMAHRFACEVEGELAGVADPAAQAAILARRWAQLTELGWTATAIPEEAGGAGGDLAELAALAGGAGRAGLALPIASACGVVPALLAGQPPLAEVASGAMRVVIILPGAACDDAANALRGGAVLEGAVVGIETPPAPTHLLIVLEAQMLLLPVATPGIESASFLRIDGRIAADFRFGAVPIQPGWVLARGPEVLERVAVARDLGALLTCVECVAAMGALLEQTIQYLLNRFQFGQPLASFQVLRHRVADIYVEYESLRGITARALRAAVQGEAAAWQAIAFAKLRLGEAGRAVAESAIQAHGGMGMTEELPAIRLCKRLMMADFEYGNRVVQAARLLADAA